MRYVKYFFKNIEEIVAGIGVAIMLFAMGFNVFARYFFNSPTSWSDELCIICLAYVTFLGGAAAYKRNAHYGMDYLVGKMPDKYKLFLRRIFAFVLTFLFAYATYLGIQLTMNAVKLFPHTRWSYKIMDAAFPLGFFSMTLHSAYYAILSLVNPEKFLTWYDSNYEQDED